MVGANCMQTSGSFLCILGSFQIKVGGFSIYEEGGGRPPGAWPVFIFQMGLKWILNKFYRLQPSVGASCMQTMKIFKHGLDREK